MHKDTEMTGALVRHLGSRGIFFQAESFARLWRLQVLELIRVV